MDGRLRYSAFLCSNYTQITREDADAIYAYLRSLPPVEQPNRAHAALPLQPAGFARGGGR